MFLQTRFHSNDCVGQHTARVPSTVSELSLTELLITRSVENELRNLTSGHSVCYDSPLDSSLATWCHDVFILFSIEAEPERGFLAVPVSDELQPERYFSRKRIVAFRRQRLKLQEIHDANLG